MEERIIEERIMEEKRILTEAEKLERCEKVMTKCGANYESAKSALVACDWDILDSIIYLEKLGKIDNGFTSYYNSEEGTKSEYDVIYDEYSDKHKRSTGSEDFKDGIKRIYNKSLSTHFEVERNGKIMISVPVFVLVLALAFAFWVTLPLMVVGLFMDCHFSFSGIEKTEIDLNDVCSKASNLADDIKANVKNHSDKED